MDPQKTPNRPVMDIQRPKPNVPPSPVPSSLDNPMAPAEHIVPPMPGEVVGHQPGEQPPTIQTQPAQPHPPAGPKKKRTGLLVGIVTAVVVVLLAIGVGGFIWYQNSGSSDTPVITTNETSEDRVSVDDIDNTISDIDRTLNTLDDTNDITANEIQDGPLGL
ncbi:hypothetical protein KC963_04225 [Candidatus Saccharibacteria bacterium]|nr:hypothetical protein [Candidatus Saccharibacteria bacterium]